MVGDVIPREETVTGAFVNLNALCSTIARSYVTDRLIRMTYMLPASLPYHIIGFYLLRLPIAQV